MWHHGLVVMKDFLGVLNYLANFQKKANVNIDPRIKKTRKIAERGRPKILKKTI